MNLLLTIDSKMFNELTPDMLSECLEKLYISAKMAVIDAGTPVGIISAQSITEPMT